jgi:hypothetical protein
MTSNKKKVKQLQLRFSKISIQDFENLPVGCEQRAVEGDDKNGPEPTTDVPTHCKRGEF